MKDGGVDVESLVFEFPDESWAGGRLVDMPFVHKVMAVGRFLAGVLREAANALRAGAELPAVLTALACADYMAGFRCGQETRPEDYRAFMSEFFPPSYTPFVKAIYRDLRCGLMHNLTVVNSSAAATTPFRIVAGRSGHLEMMDGRCVFSVSALLEDTWRAWWRYAHTVVMTAAGRRALFEQRFNRLGGAAAFMVKEAE